MENNNNSPLNQMQVGNYSNVNFNPLWSSGGGTGGGAGAGTGGCGGGAGGGTSGGVGGFLGGLSSFMGSAATPMGIGLSLAGSVIGAIGARKAQRKAKKEAQKAKKELDKQKEAWMQLDTSNPYLNMENTMEDLTINQKQSQFQKQQFQQSQANILDSLRGSAGGGGVAALAQQMAQSGQLASQQSAADIGRQEAANQQAERSMA